MHFGDGFLLCRVSCYVLSIAYILFCSRIRILFYSLRSPHPGNIFVPDDGRIGLIDSGQVKQISGRARETLAKVMIALDDRESDEHPADLETISRLALELEVELNEGTPQVAPCGYDKGELSPNSPVNNLPYPRRRVAKFE